MIDFLLPDLSHTLGGPDILLLSWLHPAGTLLTAGMPVLLLATQQAEIVLPCPVAGQLTEILQPEGQHIQPGSLLARISPEDAVDQQLASQQESAHRSDMGGSQTRPLQNPAGTGGSQTHPLQSREHRPATPLARAIAARATIALDTIIGTGDQGRITARDVRSHRQLLQKPQPVSFDQQPAAIQAVRSSTEQSAVPLLPICSANMLCDATAMLSLSQKQYRGLPISPLVCLAAACRQALVQYPQASAFWSEEGIIRRRRLCLQIMEPGRNLFLEKADDLNLYGLVRHMAQTRTEHKPAYPFLITQRLTSLTRSSSIAPALSMGPIEIRACVEQIDQQECISFRPYSWLSFSYDARILSLREADCFLAVVVQLLERMKLPDV